MDMKGECIDCNKLELLDYMGRCTSCHRKKEHLYHPKH